MGEVDMAFQFHCWVFWLWWILINISTGCATSIPTFTYCVLAITVLSQRSHPCYAWNAEVHIATYLAFRVELQHIRISWQSRGFPWEIWWLRWLMIGDKAFPLDCFEVSPGSLVTKICYNCVGVCYPFKKCVRSQSREDKSWKDMKGCLLYSDPRI